MNFHLTDSLGVKFTVYEGEIESRVKATVVDLKHMFNRHSAENVFCEDFDQCKNSISLRIGRLLLPTPITPLDSAAHQLPCVSEKWQKWPLMEEKLKSCG